ncbi:MAG: hypothetical protein E7654_02075 [Ruminococcaceae bacterium]|nr:hypothetical protein [Oscillospiraceae bacterium]
MEIKINGEVRRFVGGEVILYAETAVPALPEEGRGAVRFNRFYRQAAEAWFTRCEGMTEELSPGRYYASLCCTAEDGEKEIGVGVHLRLCFRGRILAEESWEQRWKMPGGQLLPRKRQKPTKSKRRQDLP